MDNHSQNHDVAKSTHTTQRRGPQLADSATNKPRRKRRLSELLPGVRQRITPWFDAGVDAERIANDLNVSPVQVLEHVVRDYVGARHPGPIAMKAGRAA